MKRAVFRAVAAVWLIGLAALVVVTIVGLRMSAVPEGPPPRPADAPPATWLEVTYERLAFEADGSVFRFERWETVWERPTVGDRCFVRRKTFPEVVPMPHRCGAPYPRAEREAALRALLERVRGIDPDEDEVATCADGGQLAFTSGSCLILVDAARRFTVARGRSRLSETISPWVREAITGLLDPGVGGSVYVRRLREAAAGCEGEKLYPALGLLVTWPGEDRLALWVDAIRSAGHCAAVLRVVGGHIGTEVQARGAEVVPALDRAADALGEGEEAQVARLLGAAQPLGARCAAVHVLRRRAGAVDPFEVTIGYAERGEAWRLER